MSKVKQAYENLQQAIRDEYGLEPIVQINIHSRYQKPNYEFLRSGMRVRNDFGEEMRFSDGRSGDGRVVQWVNVGPFTLFG